MATRRHISGPERHHVLVVDDDADLRVLLTDILERAGLRVTTAGSGLEALRTGFATRPDLIVLDLGLPDLDGLEVLRRVREMTDLPVMILTARDLELDKVEGLTVGADDYVTKPFSNAEVVARVKALLRRSSPASGAATNLLTSNGLEVDLLAHTARKDGHALALSPIEWNLLVAFLRHPDQVLSTHQLLELAWADPVGVGPERVKFAVLRLRRRLGWQDPASSPIESVRGFGYRYRVVSRA